ncbi:MAG: hypothetical protein PWR27_2152 [Petroclostridium sp.]|nr:hypothetical protein [Petroclostridium sp.]
MEDRIKGIFEETNNICESFMPVISSLKSSEDAKEIALAIEEIDLKFDELDELRFKAIRLCNSLFREAISRVSRDAIEKVLREEELTRISVILRDIMND